MSRYVTRSEDVFETDAFVLSSFNLIETATCVAAPIVSQQSAPRSVPLPVDSLNFRKYMEISSIHGEFPRFLRLLGESVSRTISMQR